MSFAIHRRRRANITSRGAIDATAATAPVEFAAAGTAPGPGKGLREE